MTKVILRPDATVTDEGLAPTGAASLHAALADNSDSTYVANEVPGTSGRAYIGFAEPSLPAGAVMKSLALRARLLSTASGSTLVYFGGTDATGGQFASSTVSVNWGTATTVSVGAGPVGAATGIVVEVDADPLQRVRVQALYVDATYVTKPTLTVDAPTGTVTTTNLPTVTWTALVDPDGGLGTGWSVIVYDEATYTAPGFDPVGSLAAAIETASEATTGNLTADSYKLTRALANGNYRAYVRVRQTVNGASHYSDRVYGSFSVNLTPPPAPAVTLAAEPTQARTRLDVDPGSNPTSDLFEIERSLDSGVTWSALRTVTGDGLVVPNLYDDDDTAQWVSTGTISSNQLTMVSTSTGGQAFSGTKSRYLRTIGTSGGSGEAAVRRQTPVAVAPGDTVNIRAVVYNAGTISVVRVRPRFLASDGVTIVGYGADVQTGLKNQWVKLNGQWTVPAGAALASLEVYGFSSAASQTVFIYFESAPLAVNQPAAIPGGATVWDVEAPNGRNVSYRARALHDAGGSYVSSTWATTSGQWSSTQAWLKHPTVPALNAPVDIKGFGDVKRAGRQGIFQPLGSTAAIVVSDTRGPRTGQLVLQCQTDAQRDAIDALLAQNATLLLQGAAGAAHIPVPLYLSIGDQSRAPVVDNASMPRTLDTLTWTQVPSPSGDLVAWPTA